MMTVKLQITILLALVVALAAIVNMIRRKSLELKYALSWLFALAAVAIFAAFPRAMVVMARFLGIDAPVNMIFFLGFCFSLVIIYVLTVSLSRMSTKMRRLTQIIALNEDRIKELEQRLDLQAGDERETAALTSSISSAGYVWATTLSRQRFRYISAL